MSCATRSRLVETRDANLPRPALLGLASDITVPDTRISPNLAKCYSHRSRSPCGQRPGR